jgi:hypothetical protein
MCTDLPFAFPIRVPDNMLVALGEFTGLRWNDSFGLEPFICEAIRNYMQPAPAAQEQAAAPSESGYQWKEVFLPEGTRLRAGFDRKQYFAVVAGAEIKYGEYAISPSCFANLYGSGNRNAWKAVWLRLPGSTEWLLADVCRSARKAAIARLMAGDADRSSQSSPAAPLAPQDVGEQPAKPVAKHPPQQPTGAGAIADSTPARAVPRPATLRSQPGPNEVRASSASSAGHGDEVQRSSGRSARRKRHAKKHIHDNPR